MTALKLAAEWGIVLSATAALVIWTIDLFLRCAADIEEEIRRHC